MDSILFAGVSFRGDEDLGTDTIVSRYFSKMVRFDQTIPDTTVSRYLVASPDSTREASVLFAIAYDSGGNMSADTVPMTIGGPRVTFLTLEDDQQIQSGLSLNLQVEAADPEGVLEITIADHRGLRADHRDSVQPAARFGPGGHRRGDSGWPHRVHRGDGHSSKRAGRRRSGWSGYAGDRGLRDRG